MRRVRATIGGVEKQKLLFILSVCLQPYSSSMNCACAVLYCHLWSVRLYNIFPYYLINGPNLKKVHFLYFYSLHLFMKHIYLVLRRIWRDVIVRTLVSIQRNHYYYQMLVKLNFPDRFLRSIRMSNFFKIRPVGADRLDEANGLFSQFCEST